MGNICSISVPKIIFSVIKKNGNKFLKYSEILRHSKKEPFERKLVLKGKKITLSSFSLKKISSMINPEHICYICIVKYNVDTKEKVKYEQDSKATFSFCVGGISVCDVQINEKSVFNKDGCLKIDIDFPNNNYYKFHDTEFIINDNYEGEYYVEIHGYELKEERSEYYPNTLYYICHKNNIGLIIDHNIKYYDNEYEYITLHGMLGKVNRTSDEYIIELSE
jgi:hypothetical protein